MNGEIKNILLFNFVFIFVSLYFIWNAIQKQTRFMQVVLAKLEEQKEAQEELDLEDKLEALADKIDDLKNSY